MDLKQLKVMIVEDQQNARATLRHMLGEIGINQIFEANDGDTARDLMDMDESMVDIIICDWNMPKFEGIELLKHIRARGFRMPFLMITARTDTESVIEAKNAGVTGYIRKPFSMSDLEGKVKKLAANM